MKPTITFTVPRIYFEQFPAPCGEEDERDYREQFAYLLETHLAADWDVEVEFVKRSDPAIKVAVDIGAFTVSINDDWQGRANYLAADLLSDIVVEREFTINTVTSLIDFAGRMGQRTAADAIEHATAEVWKMAEAREAISQAVARETQEADK